MLPASKPLAFISDIHGNLPALRAVLDELARQHITDIYVAGDIVFGGDNPLEVWLELQKVGATCIRGLTDDALVSLDVQNLVPKSPADKSRLDLFKETRKQLGELVLERIRRLPQRLRLPLVDGNELLLVHGSPADHATEITHDLDDDMTLQLLNDDPATIVICGSTHVPFEKLLEDVRVVNIGSVGQAPEGNFAHYTTVSPRIEGALIDQSWVEYNASGPGSEAG